MVFGFIIHTAGMIYKTIEAGHAPFVNMYESIIFFTWSMVLLNFFVEYKYKIKFISIVTIIFIILGLLYSKTLTSDPEPLVPALQSLWLEIHVATSFIGYAGFALGYGIGLLYLLKSPKESDKIPSNFTIFNIAFVSAGLICLIAGIVLKFIEMTSGIMIFSNYDINGKRISLEFSGIALSNVILFIVYIVGFIAIYFICFFWRKKFTEKLISLFSEFNISIVFSLLIYYIINIITAKMYFFKSVVPLQIFYLKVFACLFVFSALLSILIIKRNTIESYLPDLNVLDSIIFILISFGFPFLTIGIVTGAIWANSAWGSYWGWDPKETWSLITWFVYSAYLHARYTKGWRDAKASYLAIYGFIAVIFTYFGVNLFFTGLHSYS
ncbi:c-type cytochrome biogenesis protein CcsB [Candidatus Poribacteria bacterium]|nr:c-type cytochrome biogenesis protein CcsB [Candidatus Poribacteria bacterium]